MRRDINVHKDNVGYLPTINSPATEISSVHEIMRQAMSIKDQLGLKNIVLVLDQAIFSKACDLMWSFPESYGNIIPMMGNFHTICNLLSIIGKLFEEYGLRDLAVESGTVAEGSVTKVMEGRHYNRGVRFHKLMYEALMRVIWSSFQEWLETTDSEFCTEFAVECRIS